MGENSFPSEFTVTVAKMNRVNFLASFLGMVNQGRERLNWWKEGFPASQGTYSFGFLLCILFSCFSCKRIPFSHGNGRAGCNSALCGTCHLSLTTWYYKCSLMRKGTSATRERIQGVINFHTRMILWVCSFFLVVVLFKKQKKIHQLVLGVQTSDNLHKVEMQTSLFVAMFFEGSELTLCEIIFLAMICRSATAEVTWDDSDICDQVKISSNTETCECAVVLYPIPFDLLKHGRLGP